MLLNSLELVTGGGVEMVTGGEVEMLVVLVELSRCGAVLMNSSSSNMATYTPMLERIVKEYLCMQGNILGV